MHNVKRYVIIGSRTIATQDNCRLKQLPPRKIATQGTAT